MEAGGRVEVSEEGLPEEEVGNDIRCWCMCNELMSYY